MSAPAEKLKMTEAWKQWEGELVDRKFPLVRILGGSDHSAVFLTEYGQPFKRAALKFVEAKPATASQLLSRWERVAKLSHGHLLRLLHFGRCQLGSAGMLYVVTELADDSLAQIVPSRPLNPSEAEYMLRSVLEVLAYLHAQGLVHGRIKPANVMAVGDQLKLSSDGICAAGEKALSVPPTIYDPPELTTAGLSPPGDVWSLGITLVEALTQRPSVGEGIRLSDPLLPETVPASFVEIARQCLRLDPQRRWTVPDIAAHLLPTAAPPPRTSALRRLFPAVLVAIFLVALIAGPKLRNWGARLWNEIRPSLTAARPEPAAPAPPESAPATGSTTASNAEKPGPVAPAPESPAPAATKAFVAGAVAQRALPSVAPRARNTITGKVRVRVRVSVDASGHVVDAHFDSRGPSAYFAKLALDSSRRWKFTPPEVNGAPAPSAWILRYEFGRAGTEVRPDEISPRK
jgi:TonB family protein